ncbi:MAG: hypothetical protein ABL903_11830 [Methylococcales bacterium]
MQQYFKAAILISAGLFSTGCMNPKRPALHDFGLTSPTQIANKPLITVDAPTWFWDNRIRYRLLYSAPTRVRFYGLDLWVASPPELIEQHLLNSAKTLPYPLVIHLLDFEQQFDNPNKARVVVRFSVEAHPTDNQHKIGEQLFSLEQVTKTPDAVGAVEGFSALIRQATDKIQDWSMTLNRDYGRKSTPNL